MPIGGQREDEVHWHRELPQGNRAAGVRARQRLDAGARSLVRAAALASRAPAGYFGARHERWAAARLERARFEEPQAAYQAGAAPPGRRYAAAVPALPTGGRAEAASAVLARALPAAEEATRHFRATGGLSGFEAAVAHGVSKELVDALHQLLRGAETVRISVAWSPTAGPPPGLPDRPAAAVFTAADLTALERAARRYVELEPSVPVRVTGTVVRLRRWEPAGEGTARLRVLAGADVAQVRARLGEEAYRSAVHAHLAGVPVVVEGRLESRTGFRRLAGARGLSLVEPGAERRRALLARLREGLDDFAALLDSDADGRARGEG
ncbi:hypothetical protein [Streptomyces sulphureus]|uniref:hypothetical protein n=1 Tax=Streptomyces sulphureus TaxID=47758 RepID=UPI0003616CDE|nr:hypothetical protein [Streptomyces sulphureus]